MIESLFQKTSSMFTKALLLPLIVYVNITLAECDRSNLIVNVVGERLNKHYSLLFRDNLVTGDFEYPAMYNVYNINFIIDTTTLTGRVTVDKENQAHFRLCYGLDSIIGTYSFNTGKLNLKFGKLLVHGEFSDGHFNVFDSIEHRSGRIELKGDSIGYSIIFGKTRLRGIAKSEWNKNRHIFRFCMEDDGLIDTDYVYFVLIEFISFHLSKYPF